MHKDGHRAKGSLAQLHLRVEGSPVRRGIDNADDQFGPDASWPEDVYVPPRRRTLGAWIVTLCLLLSLGLLGLAADKRFHFVALATHRMASPSQIDPRVETLLADGERALSNGELDGAQGDFDKASVLTDRDPRALLGVARVAAAKADVPWLKLRLLPSDATEDARVTKAELSERVALARPAADEALSAAPQDPRALLAKLDSLRLAGDSDGARAYVVAVFSQANQPETAYALAALELQQPTSPWATIVDRLRVAARAEGESGRARAALIYALAKSGDVAGAKAELVTLDAQTRPYPLLPNLHAWMGFDRPATVAATPDATPPAAAPSRTDVLGASGSAQTQPSAATAPPPATAVESNRPSPPPTLESATQAVRRGEFERAEHIYQSILAKDPNESQALAGLGDVLRLRGDPWGAIDTYQRAININPSYLPALLGLADTQWARGDHAGAAKTYKRIVERLPEGMYPAYVGQRATP
jgi:tetratricopeptide (TPR) repeat protein